MTVPTDDQWQAVATQLRAEMGWRPVPPDVACPWCGAEPGTACHAITSSRRRRRPPRIRSTPDGCHEARRSA